MALMKTYARLPVAFTHGRGVRIFDTEGRSYLDALAGIAVSTLGHAHPDLVAAVASQAEKLLHTSNLYRIPEQEELAGLLVALSGMSEAFFCNSGCEANEAAIKLARFYGHKQGISNPVVIVMEKAFHGRTLATLSATGNRKAQAGFEPLVAGFVRVPYNDLKAVRTVIENNPSVVAVLLEMVQGEGGVRIADLDYQRNLRQLCSEKNVLMICDEVQCGLGRTGRWFAYQHADIIPDIITLAKGLASGVPIGACLAQGKAANLWGPGNHGSTFGGNQLASVAALTTLRVIDRDNLLLFADKIGRRILDGLNDTLAGQPGVVAVRGRGLMIGVELDRPCVELMQLALEAGLLISVTSERVIRLLPALIINEAEADELVGRLSELVRTYLSSHHPRA